MSTAAPFQLKYGIRSMEYLEFIGTDWDSCDKYSSSEICYGRKGSHVLDQLHAEFEVVNNKNRYSEDVGVIIALSLMFKAAYVFFLVTKSRRSTAIVPHTNTAGKKK